jgi:hypothetical protein
MGRNELVPPPPTHFHIGIRRRIGIAIGVGLEVDDMSRQPASTG